MKYCENCGAKLDNQDGICINCEHCKKMCFEKFFHNRMFNGRTVWRYDEYLAKRILENLHPDKYNDLEKKEKPDLRTNYNTGIEVTNAIPRQYIETMKMFSSNHPSVTSKSSACIKKKHLQADWNIQYNRYIFDNRHPAYNIICAIQNKLELLNKEYDQLNDYELFVLYKGHCIQDCETQFSRHLHQVLSANRQEKYYSTIYLYAKENDIGKLYLFDAEGALTKTICSLNLYEVEEQAWHEFVQIELSEYTKTVSKD